MYGQEPNAKTQAERERRRSRNRKLVLGFFLFIGVVVALESPLMRVRHLVVSGNKTVPSSAILSGLPIEVGSSIWQVNARSIQRDVMDKHPMVQSVNVVTEPFKGTVEIQVQERHVVAVYEQQGAFYEVLNDGVIYQSLKASTGFAWPIITTGSHSAVEVGKTAPDAFVAELCKQLGQAPQNLVENISEIHLDSYGGATIYLNNGFAAQCKAQVFATMLPNIYQAIQYFSSRGYQPGMVDMTGAPPYRYTPFSSGTAKGG